MNQFCAEAVPLGTLWTVGAFCSSEEAASLGLDNRLPLALLSNARLIAGEVARICEALGDEFVLTSGYRTAALCEALGSSAKSWHVQALAVDGFFRRTSVIDACDRVARSGWKIREIEAKQTQVHFAYGPSSARILWRQYVAGGKLVRVSQFL